MLKKYEKFILKENTIINPNLSIVVPGGCNANCQFCFWKKTKTCNNYLEKMKVTLSNLPSQFYQLSLTGGEPTLSPYLEDIVNSIDREKFRHTVLTTNGANLLEKVNILKGKIDHINISRHHYDDNINNSIFNSKMITTEQLKNVTNELNKVGIDVTYSAVLSENLSTKEEIETYIQFAKENGASQVFFRKPHGTLDPTNAEKSFESIESKEYSCPVCRTKNQIINDIRISWKASLEEPSKELGTIYELIMNENAELTKDWEGKLKVDSNKINENVQKIFESCGGGDDSSSTSYSSCGSSSYSSCGSSSSSSSSSSYSSCGTSQYESCGGGYSGCGGYSEPSGPPYYLTYRNTKITIDTDEELEQILQNFDLKKISRIEYKIKKVDIVPILDLLDLLRNMNKYNL